MVLPNRVDSRTLQPHEGSSETSVERIGGELFVRFNPTRVRLKQQRLRTIEMTVRELQPHEGSSETLAEVALAAVMLGFNPTRVRLKRGRPSQRPRAPRASTPRGFV